MTTDLCVQSKEMIQEIPGAQWLGFCTFTAEGLCSVSCQGTKIPQVEQSRQKHKTKQNKTGELIYKTETDAQT